MNDYRRSITDEKLFSPARTVQHLTTKERRRKVTFTVVSLLAKTALLLLAYYLAPFTRDSRDDLVMRLCIAVGILAVAVVLSAKSILDSDFPVMRAVDGVVTLILFMAVMFASSYLMISTANPDAFSRPLGHTSALYFTITTSTTIGYGDISPLTEPSQIVVMIHMVVSVLLVVIAARLLLQTAKRRVEAS